MRLAWQWTTNSYYYTGVVADGENVTVDGCEITIKGTKDFTAGIWIIAKTGTATGNTVNATGVGENAVAALGVWDLYVGSITITDNTLTAQYETGRNPKPNGAPASAIFIAAMYEDSTAAVNISGNTLSGGEGGNASTQYSFYINAYPNRGTDVTAGGTDALRSKNFSNHLTTWATHTTESEKDSIRKVFDQLITNNSAAGDGKLFGVVMEPILYSDGKVYFEVEQYQIANSKVEFVNFYGNLLNSEKSAYDFAKDYKGRWDVVTGGNFTGYGYYYGHSSTASDDSQNISGLSRPANNVNGTTQEP